MEYRIEFVDDQALPEGHDFLLAQTAENAVIFYRESAISPEMLEDSWAAFRALGKPRRDHPTLVRPGDLQWPRLALASGG